MPSSLTFQYDENGTVLEVTVTKDGQEYNAVVSGRIIDGRTPRQEIFDMISDLAGYMKADVGGAIKETLKGY